VRIKNWHEFQHFKDRRPPWIKLHRDILEKRDINMISDCSFRVLVGCWLLASEDKDMQGVLPDVEEIAFRMRMPKDKIEKSLRELKPFIEQDDISLISNRYQLDYPETETETETKTETETYMRDKRGTLCVFGEFGKVKLTDPEYQKLCDKHGKEKADAGIRELDAWLERTGKKRKNHYACLSDAGWMWEKIGGQQTIGGRSWTDLGTGGL
jgi:hypothetical protein